MNKEVETGQLTAPNIQLGSETGFIKPSLQLELANEHLALEHAISVRGTVTTPSPLAPKQTVDSTIHTLYYFATANCGGGAYDSTSTATINMPPLPIFTTFNTNQVRLTNDTTLTEQVLIS